MIQRIQSVFLFLAALAMALLFLFPYVEVGADDYFIQEYMPQLIFAAIFILGSIITIFLFRNRLLQLRLTRILLIFLLAFVVYAVYQLFQIDFENVGFERGSLLPAFAAYFLSRAMNGIQKDESLVRGMDRLR